MEKARLEAFTDGVVAIIITIMVLEIKVPEGSDFAALKSAMPVLLSYALSYVNVGIFWNNHHHMLQATGRVNGRVLWANLFLLFCLSLIPFAIRWINESHYAALPTAFYGVSLVGSSIGYLWVQGAIIACNGGENSKLAQAVGQDSKGKASFIIYLLSIPLAFVQPWISVGLFVIVATMWLIPDKRIEETVD